MNICECNRMMDRIGQAINQLVNSMISSRNTNSMSLTDSGQTLNNMPDNNNNLVNNNDNNFDTGMFLVAIAFLAIFALFLRAIQRNNNNTNINNNEENKEINKGLSSRKI